MKNIKSVYIGLSGGVDSAVTASLLKQGGFELTGVYMKNWSADIVGTHCPWREDLASARAVASHLQIPLKIYDFEADYKRAVVDYMVASYKKGLTPNPDVMCNQEIKFKAFAKRCFDEGADLIATGHYARLGFLSQRNSMSDSSVLVQPSKKNTSLRASNLPRFASELESQRGAESDHISLLRARDPVKDQTYFLYRMSQDVAKKVLFPLGDYHKAEVRKLATELDLPNADRRDSQGLCFVGKVPLRDFLSQYITPQPGDIIDRGGEKVGRHDGAFYYTIGQRHGLGVGGGAPYFVYDKDIKKNIVYVTTEPDSMALNRDRFNITDCVWWSEPRAGEKYAVRIRHGGKLLPAVIYQLGSNKNRYEIRLSAPERAIAPGQSAVFYDGEKVLGGGVIA